MGSNYAATGNFYHKDDAMCELYKVQLKGAAYLYYNLWKLNRLTLSPEEESSLLLGIELAQSLKLELE